jgi:GWxTD domain-containing protein
MRRSYIQKLFVFSIAVLVAGAANAQLSPEYAEWHEGPAGFLLTKKEKKEWKKIKTDAQAEAFIELFWAKRNPNPETSFNVFKAEFDSKVKYAAENFAYTGNDGTTTDRAKVLILMGRPEGIQTRGPANTVPGIGNTSGGTDAVDAGTQVWYYNPANLPDGFEIKGSQLFFMFYEEKMASNNFILDRSARESFKGQSALTEAPDVYLLHPDMKEVPKPVSLAGARKAPAEHLAWLGSDAPFNESARLLAELGMNDGVTRPLWVHIELPTDAPTLEFITGQVSTAEGEVLSNFEIDAVPLNSQYGTAYHLSFPLEAGAYAVDLVGGAAGAAQVSEHIETEIAPVAEDGPWLSPIWLGIAASPNEQAKLGDAYSFGGWHLVPVSGPDFTKEQEIAFFGFLVRPAANEEGNVELKARIRVKRDGKPLGRPLNMPLDASQVWGDLYMYGNSIGLSGLPEAGSYEIEFEVEEDVSEISVERAVPVDLAE